MDSDVLLIGHMRFGDEDAIETFVRKYYPVILRYCRMKLSNQNDAEDAVQETFERFFRSFDQYRHYGKAVNYLYVIAGNICKDHYRNDREAVQYELIDQSDEPMVRTEQRMMLRQAMLSLPTDLRETALLYFVQELKQKEIARILGISLPLVKYRIKRARLLLKNTLGKEVFADV